MVKRRERTRHLIELGGLVIKAKLDELTADDRTVIYGALLILAAKLKSADGPANIEVWRRHGKRAFEAEAEAKDTEPRRQRRAQQGQTN
ncbi:conjugal transfer protein TraD [Asticcacaulis sp. ZE23SCel15]|uniref:conjugal transfer protein TraD n=1 Tax=Asticcacaulis sp. ZE23SCel15 TaxID=3059027 RepID=UPI00265D7152|nr:conjugal transfer protein TraD [Asticcacaulis sp. ZE23SCel15]WKL57386.1 conjugal transfer protein TraD [Asticcacaulis sp. ZE23SCel15]